MNKKVFTTKINDQDIELAIVRPSPKVQVESQLEYNKAWRIAEAAGNPLRKDMDRIAKERGIWDDEKENRVEEIVKQIVELEKKLRGGANSFKSKNEAKEVAFKIRRLRFERMSMLRARLELDSVTAESFADTARTNFIISQTTVYNDSGKKFFTDVNDFVDKSNDQVALDAAVNYYSLLSEDNQADNYEDEFLKKYKFVDDKGRLINSDGHLITDNGKLINEENKFVNEQNELVNVNGDRVLEDGTPIVEFREWD